MLRRVKYLFIIILILPSLLTGQTDNNSPYSRYGIGDIVRHSFGKNRALGGISMGLRDPNAIVMTNPASLSARDTMSFLFEFGIIGKSTELSSGELTDKFNDINFNHLAIAFPITKWLGTSVGIIPYSNQNYNILGSIREGDPSYNPAVGNMDYKYIGNGGISQFYIGNAVKLNKNLSVGFNFSYLFGKLERIRSVSFVDSVSFVNRSDFYNTQYTDKTIIGDIKFDWGLQYTAYFKQDLELTAGAIFSNNTKLSADHEVLQQNIIYSVDQGIYIDTILNYTDKNGHIFLPAKIGAGFTFRKGDKFLIGVDYFSQNWSDARFFGESDSLQNINTFLGGIEFVPNIRNVRNYLNFIHYRIGGHYTSTYLQLKGEQLTDFGISFGLGLPLKGAKSMFNISFEMGQRGTLDNNLIKEKYSILSFSLTLHDFWFIQRKFD
ncbi:MAG: hypothetical protein IIB05_07025 [Bacteroidetes bacterium]|nr:hypothetical protein [Bacteroidota bacterium]